MSQRVSVDDLEFAATWLDNYEGQDDDENNAAAVRVAAWLRAEIAKRAEDVGVRAIVAQTGVEPARARAALRRAVRPQFTNPT
jgi:hypothetical protein